VEGPKGRSVASSGGYSDNYSGGADRVENAANANLIAAAPELYEALEACRMHGIRAGWAEDSLLIEGIDKALRKARGEA
jgi:hypothetical protein